MKKRSSLNTVRLACTSTPSGPGLYHLLEVMGKEKTLGRIDKALGQIRTD